METAVRYSSGGVGADYIIAPFFVADYSDQARLKRAGIFPAEEGGDSQEIF